MKEYLSYYSAALMWDIPYIEVVLGHEIEEIDLTDMKVSKHNARFRNNGRKVHSSECALPAGALKTLNGRTVASPELLFLELASKLSIHRLILLGMQMCSHPPGCPSMAITTKQRISTFLAKTPGYKGHRKAIRAVRYLLNGSASIMESLTYMILALPHALGGYGLNGAVFNYKIRLKREAQFRLGKRCCFTDLYYRQAKLAVEYESFAYHNSPSEQGRDVIRSAVLERQGVDVMHLTTIQLYDRDACEDFAYNLAARLGKRMQVRAMKFEMMHTYLRALLPERQNEAAL